MNEADTTHLMMDPILVVDDEAASLTLLQDELNDAGCKTVGFTRPEQALEEIKKRKFSVILADQRMPGMSGLELLAQMRELQPAASRILITGVLQLNTVIEAINKGEVFRFVVKPWLREELLATVKNGTHRYELICRNEHLQQATQSMNEQLIGLNRSLEQQVKLVAQKNEELAELNVVLERNLSHSIQICVHTMQTFYPTLGNQARRVYQLCQSIAEILELNVEDARTLKTSAWLYDIGLIGAPRQIIKHWQEDPETLDVAERALIEPHPILGQELAVFGGHLDKVGEIIRAHHEWFDGSGYPDQLSGVNIPWLARLLSVAVTYASCQSVDAEAIEKVKADSGTAFDPEAVRAFLRAQAVAVIPKKERQVMLADLRPGMVLAKGIYTYNGLLLVPEGRQLNATNIEKVLNHNRIQPIVQALVIYC
ncbi:MAG TPA: HD domain-containing phosphohydrolase [Candidatus Acidoferrales bacterium]|nr:HD domain-containing phosphohydrolase [Candidatus Acidoferrales bacterium]